MPRPVKQGLDYFPLDVSWDVKMQLLKARFGLLGIGCIIELYKAIYKEGYALKWDEDTRLLFASENHIDEASLDSIVSFAASKGVFHAGILDKLGMLTSSGIQKRWLRIAKDSNRTNKTIELAIDLLDERGFNRRETELSVPEIPAKNELSVPESTHSIEKERKGKETIQEAESFFAPLPKASTPQATGAQRIDLARSAWNARAPGIGPSCRLMAMTFKPEDTTDCLRVMTAYSDAEIVEAMDNYLALRKSGEHEVKLYGSFVGFIRAGVEKFCTDADPRKQFKRAISQSWPNKMSALDDRPDATTPEAIRADNARTAEEVEDIDFRELFKDSPMAKLLANDQNK